LAEPRRFSIEFFNDVIVAEIEANEIKLLDELPRMTAPRQHIDVR
jgi:hypothetical protein